MNADGFGSKLPKQRKRRNGLGRRQAPAEQEEGHIRAVEARVKKG